MRVDELVSNYVALRDKKAQIKKDYEDEAAKLTLLMDQIEGRILQHLDSTGTESARTDAGTAFKSTRSFTTVGDRDTFLRDCIDNDRLHLIDPRVSKKAVDEYVTVHGELPPGVNMRTEVTVNIRRG